MCDPIKDDEKETPHRGWAIRRLERTDSACRRVPQTPTFRFYSCLHMRRLQDAFRGILSDHVRTWVGKVTYLRASYWHHELSMLDTAGKEYSYANAFDLHTRHPHKLSNTVVAPAFTSFSWSDTNTAPTLLKSTTGVQYRAWVYRLTAYSFYFWYSYLDRYRRYRSLATPSRLTFQARLLHNQESDNAEKGGFRKISSRAFFRRIGRCSHPLGCGAIEPESQSRGCAKTPILTVVLRTAAQLLRQSSFQGSVTWANADTISYLH